MPSKALIYSTGVLHLAQRGREFGLEIAEARVDMKAVHRRKEALVAEFAESREEELESDKFSLIRERAKFVDESTVILETTGQVITADHFMVATGSVVNLPDVPGLADTNHWTSDDVLDLQSVPESVIVLGGGAVACELAQFLRRAGSRVVMIQRFKRLLKGATTQAAEAVEHAFRREGIEIYTGTELLRVGRENSEIVVKFHHVGKDCDVRAAHLFNALGRIPATGHLGLDSANVSLSETGHIKVDCYQRTSNPRIYAGGDATGPYEFVHLAAVQGILAARHATGQHAEPIPYDLRTRVIFTEPQVASVGIPLAEAPKRGIDTIVASRDFKDHGRAILMGEKDGFVKVWTDSQTQKIIGAECVGKDAGELIHSMAVAVALGATPSDLLKVQWYHPTLSDIWSYPLEELAKH